MRRSYAFLVALFTLAACVNGADQVAGPSVVARMPNAAVSSQDLRDRYIVVFRDEVTDPARLADVLVNAAGGTVHYRYTAAIKGFAATLPPQSLAGIERNPVVNYVVPDGLASVTGAGSDNSVSSWGLNRIDQRNLPLDNLYEWTTDGTGVTAYILDTGILPTHNDFGGVGGRASIGFDAYGGNGIDCHGHGTHVAGTVGGNEYGVARKVKLVAVRVLDCGGSGTWAGVISGIDWVRLNAVKPAVANMSLGGGLNSAVNDAVTNAINAGVTFAVAAGNSNGADACLSSPSSTPKALTVGATDINDARASYSNIGTCVDLFAPGSSITSDYYTSTTATATMSGTSMASPHVAGVAALYLSANTTATPAQVESAIEGAATQGKVTNPGTGSPNLLLYSRVVVAGGNSAPTASFTNSCSNLDCSFNASGSGDSDGTITTYAWNFGDGSTGTGLTPSHTYAAAGTYTVVLTVTDDDAAIGQMSKGITVTAPGGGGGITLSATGYKVKGLHKVDLGWSGATGSFDIYRNNVKLTTLSANAWTDNINAKGAGSYTYRVCQAGTTTCSNNAVVTF